MGAKPEKMEPSETPMVETHEEQVNVTHVGKRYGWLSNVHEPNYYAIPHTMANMDTRVKMSTETSCDERSTRTGTYFGTLWCAA